MQRVEASVAATVSGLKKKPTATQNEAQGEDRAGPNHNRVMAYMVPADVYEAMLDRLDDIHLAEIIKSRSDEKGVPVDIDDL